MPKKTHLKKEPRHALFVAEYLVDLNGTQAAIRAGFGKDEKSARTIASRLLAKVNIREAIQKEFSRRLERIELTQDRVLQELALIALSDILDYEVNEKTGRLVTLTNRSASRAVQSVKIRKKTTTDAKGNVECDVTTEIKLWDKMKAMELFMRHAGMLDVDSNENYKESFEQRRDRVLAGVRQILEQGRAKGRRGVGG